MGEVPHASSEELKASGMVALAYAELRGTHSGYPFEGVRKCERVLIANLLRHSLDFSVCRRQKMGCVLNSQYDQLLHGTSADAALAASA
jgi:hypothetical protein